MATLNELEMLISSINRGIVSVEVGGHFGTSNLVGSERAAVVSFRRLVLRINVRGSVRVCVCVLACVRRSAENPAGGQTVYFHLIPGRRPCSYCCCGGRNPFAVDVGMKWSAAAD